MLDANTPLVVASTNGERDSLGWRRYLGGGDPNSASNWSAAQPIGPGADPQLTTGPKGTYLFYEEGPSGNAPYVIRRWNGAGFDPPAATVIPAGGSQRQPGFHQDATGHFHAVWGSNDTMPQRLLYSSSPDGTTWSEPREIAPYKEAGYFGNRVAATGPDDGLAVTDENGSPTNVEAAPLSPQSGGPRSVPTTPRAARAPSSARFRCCCPRAASSRSAAGSRRATR